VIPAQGSASSQPPFLRPKPYRGPMKRMMLKDPQAEQKEASTQLSTKFDSLLQLLRLRRTFYCWWLFFLEKNHPWEGRSTLSHTPRGCVSSWVGEFFDTSLCWSKPKSAGQDSGERLPWGDTGIARPTPPFHESCSPALPQPRLGTEFANGTETQGTSRGKGKVS